MAAVAPDRAAAASPSPFDLAGQVEASVSAQVDSAVAQANDALAAAQQSTSPTVRVQIRMPSPAEAVAAPTIDVASASTPPLVVSPAPTGAVARASASRRLGAAGPRHIRVKRTADARSQRAATGNGSVSSTYAHASLSVTLSGGSSTVRSAASASATTHSSSKTTSSSTQRPPRRASEPGAPLPFRPSVPGLPDSGASSPGGQGSSSGAPLPILLAILGGLVAIGIPFLLRRVLWSDLRMPRRVVPPPWRPG